MRFRRAATLALTFADDRLAIHNFLTKESFTCSTECLDFLSALDEWHTGAELLKVLPEVDAGSLAEQTAQLVEFGALVVEGSPQAERDARYRREWQWGTVAGLYHFSIRNTSFLTGSDARTYIRSRRAWRKSPPLYLRNTGFKRVKALPRTDLAAAPFALMRRRRSNRRFLDKPMRLSALADCLFAGNGIVEFSEDEDFGRLPITMTPSGGARNPFELYVYARNVEGLAPGFYHYSALDHDLGLVRAGAADVPEFLGGQKWPAKAAAIVFLVANLPRTMWKYHMPMAYRVVAMEAGFIAQNILLTATHHGLSAVPSGALHDGVLQSHLGLSEIEHSVMISVSMGPATS